MCPSSDRIGRTEGREDEERFTLAFPMLWAPNVDVKIRGERNEDISIEFADILEGLDFGLMGEFYAARGRFGMAARFNYMRLKGESSREGLVTTEFRGLYRFGKLNNLWFGYRYLSIGNDVEENGLEYELNTVEHGPMLGWAFTF